MKNAFEYSVLKLLVVVLFTGVVSATDITLDDGEKNALSRLKMVIRVKGAGGIVDAHKNLHDTSKELHPHALPTRSPEAATEQHHHLKKKVVDQLRGKLDNSILKTAHGMAQSGSIRTFIEKSLNAKVAWAKEEGTQLKKFLALNAKAFETELNQYFDKLSTVELYRLVCELKALIEVLHDVMPDGRTLLRGLKEHMQHDQAIIATHTHAASSVAPEIVE